MNKKVLFVANIHNHFNAFHLPHIEWLKTQGYEVHCVANGKETQVSFVDKQHTIPLQRSVASLDNYKAYKQLKELIETEKYALVHCHTSMGGAIGRLAAANSRKLGTTRVLFTSHEFPFYENWAFKNWLTYFPLEAFLSRFADGIISINQFDFKILNSVFFSCQHKYKINGIGVDNIKFKPISIDEKKVLRKKYGFKEEDYILIYAAEHTARKNHKFVIEALGLIIDKIPNIKVLFTGRGILLEQNKKLANQSKASKHILFPGYVDSIKEYMALSDVGISASFGEGLGVNLVEELLLGKPIIASNNKGHREFLKNGINGFMFNKNDHQSFAKAVEELFFNKPLYNQMSSNAPETVKNFSINIAVAQMSKIYQEFLD